MKNIPTLQITPLWHDLMKIEEEHPNFMVGNRLSWPKPLPRKKKPVAATTKRRSPKATAAAAKA